MENKMESTSDYTSYGLGLGDLDLQMTFPVCGTLVSRDREPSSLPNFVTMASSGAKSSKWSLSFSMYCLGMNLGLSWAI